MSNSRWLGSGAASAGGGPRGDAREAPTGAVQPGDAFLIGVEGKVTEPTYLRALRRVFAPGTIRLVVVPTGGGCAVDVVRKVVVARDDRSVRRRLEKLGYAEVPEFDHHWTVFDTDRAQAEGKLRPAQELASKEGILLAPSTPCFEFWLFLHLRFATPTLLDCAAAAALLEEALGRCYAKTSQDAERLLPSFLPKLAQAVLHARRVRRYHADAGTAAPANPSTDMDLLVTALNQSAPRPHRLPGI